MRMNSLFTRLRPPAGGAFCREMNESRRLHIRFKLPVVHLYYYSIKTQNLQYPSITDGTQEKTLVGCFKG